MSENGKLSDGMWEAARAIWENTVKISDEDLRERLFEVYGENAPKSTGTISKRRKKENWVKKSLVGGSDFGSESGSKQEVKKNNGSKNTPNSPPTPENNKEESEEVGSKTGSEIIVWQEVEEKVKREVIKLAMSTEQKAQLVIKHRRRLFQLGELQENTLGVVNSLSGLKPKLDGEEIIQTIAIAEVLSKTLKQLTDSQKTIAEQELPLCGIKPEDFHQSEAEKRMQSIAALSGIDEAERQRRKAKTPELMARLKEIESLNLDDVGMPDIEDEEDSDDSDDE